MRLKSDFDAAYIRFVYMLNFGATKTLKLFAAYPKLLYAALIIQSQIYLQVAKYMNNNSVLGKLFVERCPQIRLG